jgi:phosphohistidine phosphatase SixA
VRAALRLSRRQALIGATAFGAFAPLPAWAQNDVLALMRQGGLLLFMRHANAPGVGDPDSFRIDDCATQRNLSERGRTQAAAVGQMLRREGVRWQSVQTSRWCRCQDTARLAFGQAEIFDLLNSGFNVTRAGERDRTGELRQHLLALSPGGDNRLYVTHMVNIMRLLNVNTADAEIVAARVSGAAFDVVGSLRPPV